MTLTVMSPRHGFVDGLGKVPEHFFGFGLPFGLLCWYAGWGVAATLMAWRAYEEYLDWRQERDTLPKALLDLFSQTAGTVGVALLHGLLR